MTLTQKIENLELQIENVHEEWLVAESYEEAFLARERMSLLNKNLEILKKELAKVSDSNLCEECGKAEAEEDGQIYCRKCIQKFNQEEQDSLFNNF